MLEKLKSNKNKSGFTLVEILVAISVLAIGLVAAFSVLPTLMKNQNTNTDKFLSSQIASEGVELVRNLRDKNWILGISWKTNLTACSLGCEIDYNDSGLSSPYQARFLKLNSAGFYNYEAGVNTKFKRKITVQEIGAVLNVKSEVSWNGNGSPFLVEENLYDWY